MAVALQSPTLLFGASFKSKKNFGFEVDVVGFSGKLVLISFSLSVLILASCSVDTSLRGSSGNIVFEDENQDDSKGNADNSDDDKNDPPVANNPPSNPPPSNNPPPANNPPPSNPPPTGQYLCGTYDPGTSANNDFLLKFQSHFPKGGLVQSTSNPKELKLSNISESQTVVTTWNELGTTCVKHAISPKHKPSSGTWQITWENNAHLSGTTSRTVPGKSQIAFMNRVHQSPNTCNPGNDTAHSASSSLYTFTIQTTPCDLD